ncbi:hypothetical protein V2K05_18410 [Pseudomonas alliivorans]|nr:hypothetical protein [Pseudomonas alliivorans]MEE4963578.1 hypothetical protein [Pseudomonas alliivorans]MEE4973967.1 hypothetical protein [Pseudomonas alliivorans]MEE4978745.1 hypothetical protein [Pseudomonas alliivorans]MEE4983987.1 hypothetical protein [Pseudomonas alliivorans]
MIDDGKKDLRQKWAALVDGVFDGSIPNRAEWTSSTDIIMVLNAISSPANHMFYPDGGGMDIRGARLTSKGELEWATDENGLDSFAHIAAPLKLTFWNPGPTDHEANFTLEVGALQQEGDYVGHDGYAEELAEMSDGTYGPRSAWDDGQGARLVIRYVKPGRFAIFGKGSLYNSYRGNGFDAYNAFHNDPVKFEKAVSEMAEIELV